MSKLKGSGNNPEKESKKSKGSNRRESKYSLSIIIPKSDAATINTIQSAIEAAYNEGKLKQNNKNPIKFQGGI